MPPRREGIDAAGLPAGEPLTAIREDSGSIHLYGAFPAGTELGDGRVYLRLAQGEQTLCVEAFPIYESALLGEGSGIGFSVYLSPELGLQGDWTLTVLAAGLAWPCGAVSLS